MATTITFSTLQNQKYILGPVPMDIGFPSADPKIWLKFQKSHVRGTELGPNVVGDIQKFMRDNRTECLTDGTYYYTVAGGMLAYCEPLACAK